MSGNKCNVLFPNTSGTSSTFEGAKDLPEEISTWVGTLCGCALRYNISVYLKDPRLETSMHYPSLQLLILTGSKTAPHTQIVSLPTAAVNFQPSVSRTSCHSTKLKGATFHKLDKTRSRGRSSGAAQFDHFHLTVRQHAALGQLCAALAPRVPRSCAEGSCLRLLLRWRLRLRRSSRLGSFQVPARSHS